MREREPSPRQRERRRTRSETHRLQLAYAGTNSLSFMRSLTSRVGRSGFADLPDYASCKGDIASPPGRDHGACSFVANQQVWVQQIFGGRPDSKRGLSRSFTSSKLQFLRFYSYLTCVACF